MERESPKLGRIVKSDDESKCLWDLSLIGLDDSECLKLFDESFECVLKLGTFDTISVDCSCNGISAKGIAVISDSLKRRSRNQHARIQLNLSANPFGNDGASELARNAIQYDCLAALDVHACQIGDEGAIALCQAILHSNKLEALDMSSNYITDASIDAIRGVVLRKSSFRHFYLLHLNEFSPEGVAILEKALQKSENLTSLQGKDRNEALQDICTIS